MSNLPQNPRWMQYVDDERKISELTIPGTHDTGTFQVINIGPAKCQTLKLTDQLNAGIRYLDIRAAKGNDNDGVLWLYHGKPPFGSNLNITLSQVIDVCLKFLEQNPTETILMSIKQEFGDSIHKWVEQTINKNKEKWYLGNDRIPKLKEVKGRIILLRRFDYLDIGLDCQGNFPKDATGDFSHHKVKFYVQDNYYSWSKGNNKADKFNLHIKPVLEKAAADSVETIYINFASATGISAGVLPFSSNPKDLADAVNPLLYKYLKDHPTKRYGIIPMDFPEIEKYLITRILDCSYDNPILLPRAINKATGIVYLSFGQQLYHVPAPSVAENIFSKGWDPQLLPCFNFDVASSTLLKNGKLIKFNGRNEIYLSYERENGLKPALHHIYDSGVLNRYGLHGEIKMIPEAQKGSYEILSPIT